MLFFKLGLDCFPFPNAETAINIGYSSRLLKEDMHLFVIDAEEYKEVEKQLREAKDYIDHVLNKPPEQRARYGSTGEEENMGPPGPPFGIVINGHSLVSKAIYRA